MTPRFSRLSLAAPNVVLPISARENRRQSVRGEGGKRVSLVHVAPRGSSLSHTYAMYSASTPSLRTRSRSDSLSSEGPATPSAASSVFGADNVVLVADDEYEDGVDLALMSLRDFDAASLAASSENTHAHDHKPALTSAPSAWNVSIGRHRRAHATRGTSFLWFGSGDSSATMASAFSPPQSPAHSRAPSYSRAARAGLEPPTMRVELAPYEAALEAFNPYTEVDGPERGDGKLLPATKKGGTVRRLLRTLSNVGRR